MAYEIPSFFFGVLPADVDMSAQGGGENPTLQFTAVGLGAAVNTPGYGAGGAALQLPAAMVGQVIGILQNNPIVGEPGLVMVHGVSKARCHTAWAIGQLLSCDAASGGLQPAAAGQYAVAVGLEVAVAGDISSVLLLRNGKQ